MSKSIDYGWSYKSWPGFGTGLNVISRFRFSAPPTFRAHRREYSICEDSFVLYGNSSSSSYPVAIATKHMLPAVHSIYLATSSVVMRDGEIRDAEGPRESFVSSRFDRKSGAAIDISKVHPNLCLMYRVRIIDTTHNRHTG